MKITIIQNLRNFMVNVPSGNCFSVMGMHNLFGKSGSSGAIYICTCYVTIDAKTEIRSSVHRQKK